MEGPATNPATVYDPRHAFQRLDIYRSFGVCRVDLLSSCRIQGLDELTSVVRRNCFESAIKLERKWLTLTSIATRRHAQVRFNFQNVSRLHERQHM